MKKAVKKTSSARSTNPDLPPSSRTYPVEEEDLAYQQARLKKAAVAGKKALKSKSAMRVEFSSSQAERTPRLLLPPGVHRTEVVRRMTEGSAEVQTKVVNVSFAILQPAAREVFLCGEFNDWSPAAGPMTRHEDGHWEAIVALRPGRYQYKFVVDGQWLADPLVEDTVKNEFGSLNSIIEVVGG